MAEQWGDVKVVQDPVHGQIQLPEVCVKVMDTPQFQRLRNIKQLGGVPWVFPGGSHTRFEHSLGVCHLAGRFVKALKERQDSLGIEDKDVLCVQLAGLCHDMGHGPFSHLWDKDFIPEINPTENKWKHEEASCDMVESIKGVLKEHRLNDEDIAFIKALIKGIPGEKTGRPPKKDFLYQIVANDQNGIDVDKMDYFLRDCHHLGVPSSFSPDRFIQFARVIQVDEKPQICFQDKVVFSVYELFHTRFSLHRMVYQHETVKAVELMLVDLLVDVDEEIKITGKHNKEYRLSDSREDMEAYTKLSDGILDFIRLGHSEKMKRAQRCLERLDKRDLYPCVSQTLPFSEPKELDLKKYLKEKLATEPKKLDLKDLEEKLATEHKKLDLKDLEKKLATELEDKKLANLVKAKLIFYGMEEDPVKNVKFFSKRNPEEVLDWDPSTMSEVTVPKTFYEQVVRVYYRGSRNDAEYEKYKTITQTVFKKWCDDNDLKVKNGKREEPNQPRNQGKANN